MSEKYVVILEIIVAATLTIIYFKLCSNRKSSLIGKFAEISALYGINILAFTGKIKFWLFIISFAIIGIIKILTTKKNKIETGHNGMAD